jgi:hypothetical protein
MPINPEELRETILKNLRSLSSRYPELQMPSSMVDQETSGITLEINLAEDSYGNLSLRYPIDVKSPFVSRVIANNKINKNGDAAYMVCQGQFTPEGKMLYNSCMLRNQWMYALDIPESDQPNFDEMQLMMKNTIERAITNKPKTRRGLF